MAGLRKFPKLTTSYTHTDNGEAKRKEEEASRNARPSSAPSSSQAGRQLLTSRQQQNKPYYKVTYPLRQRRKVNFDHQCNSAPNAEYIVAGRGYTFTRHNNKLTMNIDTNVFFDDKVATDDSTLRKKPASPALMSQKQRVSLQRQLEESLQVQEKLHRSLVEASVKLEEQKLEQENEREKMFKEHDRKVKEITKLHEAEKKKLMKENEEAILSLETIHASKLAEQQGAQRNRELLLKEEIHRLQSDMNKNNQRHEVELIKRLQKKEEELNAVNIKALSDLKTQMTNDYKSQISSRIKALEKQHEYTLAEKTIKHKNEIEDLISRFKDSAQIEEDFKKTSKLLKQCETEVEQLNEEKKQLTIELRSCKTELQETMAELYQYKQKFQNKVDEVKDQCDSTINRLTIENTDLRKRLLKKTEELSDLRMEEDRRLRNVQFNLKKSIIQARIKANLPVALGVHEQSQDETKESKERQGSAPITKQEKDGQRKRISSMEQEELSHSATSTHTANRPSPQHSKSSSKRQSTT